MKKTKKCFLLLMVSLLAFAGWGRKKVELLSDKKLIDLSAAIGKCTLGADDLMPEEGDNAQDANNPDRIPAMSVTPNPTSQITPTPHPTNGPKPSLPAKPRTLDIRIRDMQVMYNYVPWPDLEILKAQLQKDHDERTTFRLVDDFAEAHVYRQMLEILNELENGIGLRYIKEEVH